MTLADELERLKNLYESGALSESEYSAAKARLIQGEPRPPSSTGLGEDTWAMLLHLSQFMGYFVPLAGLLAPILIWQLKVADLPGLDNHGKVVANWILSLLIYSVLSGILVLLLIGIPMLFILVILSIVFPIIGGLKAGQGELWVYPMSIPFFRVYRKGESWNSYRD